MDRRRTTLAHRFVAAAFALPVGVFAASAPAEEPGDRAVAESLVRVVDADAAHKAVTSDVIARAKQALERATRLRAAGDEARARLAEGLARECAETARDAARAADAEAQAADLRKKAVDAQAHAERERALVEETIARIGRLKAELAQAEKDAKENRTAVEAHDDDKTPPKRKPKPKVRKDGKP